MKQFDLIAAAKESIWNLFKGCGLLTGPQVEELRAASGADATIQKLVEAARERGWINEWQCRQLLSGRREFRLGKYQLVGSLGEGGMGTVFLAEEVGSTTVVPGAPPTDALGAAPEGPAPGGSSIALASSISQTSSISQASSISQSSSISRAPSLTGRRQVALKLMAPRPPVDAHALARFLREVKAGASLQHPNIVATLEADHAGAKHFLVMEYVQGKDLGGWVRKHGPLPIGWACECIRQACLGLQHAHERGVIHRDLKPENILVAAKSLSERPVAKLLDLGLAKFTSEDGQHSQITSSGQIIGTIDYMSLEQVDNSKHVDVRADIYALGVTLFKLIAGCLPYPGRSVAERLHARRTSAPCSLTQHRADVPPGLDAVVAKAFAPQPSGRYASPQELADALAQFCVIDPKASVELRKNRGPVDEGALTDFLISDVGEFRSSVCSARPIESPWKQRRWTVAAAVAGVLLAALVAAYWFGRPAPSAALLLTVQPGGVEVFINGKLAAATSADGAPLRLSIPAAGCQLQLVKMGYAPHTQNLKPAVGGAETALAAKLSPLGRRPSP